LVPLAAGLATTIAGEGPPAGPWRDAVSYRIPDEPAVAARAREAAGWLTRHLVAVRRPGDPAPLKVVAWKDPTLVPEDPKLLAGYLITDTLWAARALRPFEPGLAAEVERGLGRAGWYGNGLHDVLFHRLDRNLHRSADADIVHGHSLGVFPLDDGRAVDLRVFRQRWDADYDVGHPHLFAEHAAYQALLDAGNGRAVAARERLLGVIRDSRATDPDDPQFWDADAGVLVDHVTRDEWLRLRRGEAPSARHFTFKLGVLLYALRVLGLEGEVGADRLAAMRARLWSAQLADGGLAHFLDVRRDGTVVPARRDATGEATAIGILSETVIPPE
jgi:hypothetical protein